MTDPTPDDELIREFATIARRLSQAIREGRVAALRRNGGPRRSAADTLKRAPARSRDTVVAAVRWAQADAQRSRQPDRAVEADRQARERGYSLDGPGTTRPTPGRVEDDLRSALTERTAQLSQLRNERDRDVQVEREQSRSLREELEAERGRGLSPTAAGAVMAGAMIAAAIDEEAERTLTPNIESAAALSPESGIDATAQRTVSIDDLVTDAHPVPLEAKLSGGAEMATEVGSEPPQPEVGRELGIDHEAELSV